MKYKKTLKSGILILETISMFSMPREDVRKIQQALNRIKAREKLDSSHRACLANFADLFVSVSLKHPVTSTIVKEVNIHHHTTKACKKYGTNCRFNFPRFPIHTTVISTPSNMVYDDEKLRTKMMSRHTKFLEGVKEVLENDDLMREICKYKEDEIETILIERRFQWKLRELVQEAEYEKKTSHEIPQELHTRLHDIIDKE